MLFIPSHVSKYSHESQRSCVMLRALVLPALGCVMFTIVFEKQDI